MVVFRRGKVFVPTMAQTEAGFFLATEPVLVAEESDSAGIEAAIISAVERGNPRVPTPSLDEQKKYVLLKHAGVKSLSAFEKLARTWKLSKHGGNFLIAPYRAVKNSGAVEDSSRQEAVPDTIPLREVVRHLMQRALNEPAGMQRHAE